jgi:ubiquinone/menaquinone biosynthesis C-methylase UbiE
LRNQLSHMNTLQTAAELIDSKYAADGADVVRTYQGLQFDKHIRLMRKHLGLKPGMRVLDVGCGTGALLVELAKAGALVTGIDTFEEADGIDRRIAEARLRENDVTAEIVDGTAATLPFPDQAFELAVNIGMLEHIRPDRRSGMLQEIFRVVRPNGYLFLIAGPTRATPFDQHIPGFPFSNWLSRDRKMQLSRNAGRRQFLAIPWGISRRELRVALPEAEFRNLYADYFRLDGGQPLGAFRTSPLWLLAWAKRRMRLHRFFGIAARCLYLVHQEHCHILAIHKRADQ